MLPAINLGPLVLPTGPLLLLLGAWLSLVLTERFAKQLGQDPALLSNLVTAVLIAGFVGARLTFVALYWNAFADNLLGIIWPLSSGYSAAGGIFFGAAAGFFYGRYKQLDPAPTLDVLAPVVVNGLIFVSLSDFFGGPGFGTNTSLPWGIEQYSIRRHPVQIYEVLVGLAALLAWWRLRDRRAYAGQLFLVTTAVYAFGRLFVDAFRADAWLIDGWHGMQIVALALTLGCLWLLARHTPTAAHSNDAA